MNQKTFKAFVSTLSLILCSSTISTCKISLRPAYTGRIETPTEKNYHFNTSIIAAKKKIEGITHLILYRASYKKKNLNQAITLINKKFKEFEIWLLNQEHEVLIALKKRLNINDEIWNN